MSQTNITKMNLAQKRALIEKVTGFGARYVSPEFIITTNKRVLNIGKINEQLAEAGLKVGLININDAGNLTIGVHA